MRDQPSNRVARTSPSREIAVAMVDGAGCLAVPVYRDHEMRRLTPEARYHEALRARLHRERARITVGSIAGFELLRHSYEAYVAFVAAHPHLGEKVLPPWSEFLEQVLAEKPTG